MFLVESIDRETFTELVIFSRDKDGKKVIESVKDFKPRFFVPKDDIVPEDNRITGVEDKDFKAISGEPLKKIYTRTSKDVHNVRDFFSKHYEADILFPQRYIINNIGEIEPYKLNIMYIDIEVGTGDVFPDMDNPQFPVITIAIIDSFTGDNIVLYYESENTVNKIKNTENVYKYSSEEALLAAFINLLNKYDPDIITGWNVEFFDIYYLIRRMNSLEIDYRQMSPLGQVFISPKFGDIKIKGRIILDLMKGYEFFRRISNQGRAESYSLEFTAQNVLGTGKLPHEEGFYDMWINNPDKLIEYNRRDNVLVKEIQEKLTIIDFFNMIRCKACAQLTDVYLTSRLIDGFLLRRCRNKYVLPSGNKTTSGSGTYSGATVIEPQPGLYDSVIGLDIKGMYPNIMKTFNTGYETFNPDGDIKISEGIAFNKGAGLISETIIDLEKERNHWKSLRKKASQSGDEEMRKIYNFKQYAVKVLTNSIYGYLGFPKARLYKKEVAEAITTTGRELIIHTKNLVEKEGYRVLYGDTDSVLVKCKGNTIASVLKEGKELVDLINVSYKTFAESRGSDRCSLEIQFEKAMKSIIFVSKRGEEDKGAKKKYAYIPLWFADKQATDKAEFTGFETVRSDTPRIGREIQKTVVEMILRGRTQEDVLEYLKELDKKIRDGIIPMEEIGFPKGISEELYNYGKDKVVGRTVIKIGIPAVIRGALYSNKYLGTRFAKGSKPKWVYIRSVPPGYPTTDVLAYTEIIPEGFKVNYDEQNKRIFDYKLGEIWKSAGWGEFPSLKQTITLDSFF